MKTKLAIIAACLWACLPTQVQAQENFAWITNTNGVTWKKYINDFGNLELFAQDQIAEIVVPEHALIDKIDVAACDNLTNIVLHPATTGRVFSSGNPRLEGDDLVLFAGGSRLRNITCKKTMRDLIRVYHGNSKFQAEGWVKGPIQWTDLERPRTVIRTLSTANGKELEIVWIGGTLQITDAVNGKWKDYNGNSPLRIPLWLGAKDKQFFRIKPEEDE